MGQDNSSGGGGVGAAGLDKLHLLRGCCVPGPVLEVMLSSHE